MGFFGVFLIKTWAISIPPRTSATIIAKMNRSVVVPVELGVGSMWNAVISDVEEMPMEAVTCAR